MKSTIKSIKIQPTLNGYVVSFETKTDYQYLFGSPDRLVTLSYVCSSFEELVERLLVEGFLEKEVGEIKDALTSRFSAHYDTSDEAETEDAPF